MPNNVHILHFLLKRELKELYLSMAIKSFALSMVGVFVPIYLLTKTSLTLNGVLFFYLLSCVVFILAIPLSAALASTYGLKHGIGISVPFYIALYLLLSVFSGYNIYVIFLLATILGLADSFFWVSLHLDLAQASDKKNRGGEIGALYTSSVLAKIAGPLIGGVILTFFSFKVLFVVACIVYLFSLLPLMFSRDRYVKQVFSFRKMFPLLKNYKRQLLTSLCYGTMNVGEVVLWPLFLFAYLHIYLEFGVIFTIAEIIIAISYSFVGEVSDHISKRKMVRGGNLLFSFIWILRYYIPSINLLLVSIPFMAMVLPLVQIPFMSLNYEAARRSGNAVEFIAMQQLFTNLGRIIILLFIIATNTLNIGFLGLAGSALIHAFFP